MQNKLFLMVLVLICTFFISMPTEVMAYDGVEVVQKFVEDECTGDNSILGDPDQDGTVAQFLEQILTIMQYAGPVLCLVLSVADFVKAAASQDKDALTKAAKTTGKRIALAMILFFIPVLIDFLFPLLGWYGTCGIG